MKLITLYQGKRTQYCDFSKPSGQFAQVSDEDYERVNAYRWTIDKKSHNASYASGITILNGIKKRRMMHRFILETDDSKVEIDHKDHNGLNNQRDNIRIATSSQNKKNRRSAINSSSQYLGVCAPPGKNHYTSAIVHEGARISLGIYPLTPEGEIAAAKAYDKAARLLHGEFANLNFKDDIETIFKESEILEGDIRIVMLPVQVRFKKSAEDHLMMMVLPRQQFPFLGESTELLATKKTKYKNYYERYNK